LTQPDLNQPNRHGSTQPMDNSDTYTQIWRTVLPITMFPKVV